ncbi:MAG: DUF3524 domain-containing protein [Gammaproteobacteria bacterium]|nr:MAG: DUF3524 domain-containing protein [Gammaproteobacteria bacterium]
MSRAGKPRILLLSGYDAGSHRRWYKQLVALLDDFDWTILSLSPRFFRWRIRGNPLNWLHEPALREQWDLVIATSMVDLSTLRGIHPHLSTVPCVLYMHENQFAYPASGAQPSSVDPQMVNLYSALSADRVVFNSSWNQKSFLDGVEALMSKMPDGVPEGLVGELEKKSQVVPVPIEDRLFVKQPVEKNWQCPHLLWNHRWEYDKGPERLLALLQSLERRRVPFRLSVVGERFRRYPPVFDSIHEQFGHRIERWGYLESRASYEQLLLESDVVVSTAVHDFQGLSMLEAMAAGCIPLAPDRLAYPEYVPGDCLYTDHMNDPPAEGESAADRLETLMRERPLPRLPTGWKASKLGPEYRRLIKQLAGDASAYP